MRIWHAGLAALTTDWWVPQLSEEELALLKTSGRIAADILDQACAAVAVGVTTEEIDAAAHAACVVHGAFPTGLGFRGFPKSCCTSVNEVVCHGIPDSRPLQEGKSPFPTIVSGPPCTVQEAYTRHRIQWGPDIIVGESTIHA
jgi:hypothetical protein